MPPGQYDAAEPNRGSLSSVRNLSASFTVVLAIAGISACGGGTAGAVWVAAASEAGDSVVRLDPQTGRKLADIDGGATPTAMAADASGVWVLDYFASTVRHISATTNSVDEALKFAPAASNDLLPDNSPDGLAVLPGAVWVTIREPAATYRIPVTR